MTRSAQLLLVVASFAVLTACGRSAPEEVETESVVPVKTALVELGTIRGVIHATGVVSPAPGADLVVIAPEPGRIVDLPKAEGDRVRRGDLLVRFEIPSMAADLTAKTAEVARAKARIQNAKAARTRAHDLYERGVAARKDEEDADRELSDAEASLTEALAAQAASEVIASRLIVRATFDGIVAKRSHNPGDMVESSASDPVLRVIDPKRLEVSALIPVPDVPRIVLGASGRIANSSGSTDDAPETVKVISRPGVVDVNTATTPIRLALSDVTRYSVGMPVELDIDAETHTNVPLVPARAVVRNGSEIAVFVVVDGKAQRRPVEIGLTTREQAEVRSGLKPGEAVIVEGQAGLPDGAAVSTTTT
jgi:RND family efflux transporter MFP subunit